MFTNNGNICKMELDRIDKAKRATFAFKQALSTSYNVAVKLAMNLYGKQIEPIFLYGCPIWGLPQSNSRLPSYASEVRCGVAAIPGCLSIRYTQYSLIKLMILK